MRVRGMVAVLGCGLVVSSCVLGDFKKGAEPYVSGGTAGTGVSAGSSGKTGTGGGSDNGGTGGGNAGGSLLSEAGAAGEYSDPCLGVTCTEPPANVCEDSEHLEAYDDVGSCAAGQCNYMSRILLCACQDGKCSTDPCSQVICEYPPDPYCGANDNILTYEPSGECVGGTCKYTYHEGPCLAPKPYCHVFGGKFGCFECESDTQCASGTCDDAGNCVD